MKIFAHRGSSQLWPENTLLAFDKAHAAGATGFETDLRLSRDDVIILSHDDRLQRLGHPGKRIPELTAAEIGQIDVPSPDGTLHSPLIALDVLLRGYPDKDYIFDCKISDARLFERLRELLTRLSFHDRIWFLTWSHDGDRQVEKYFPGYKYFPRFGRSTLWGYASAIGLGRLLEPKHDLLALPANFYNLPVFSRRQVASIQHRGKTFLGYLVNTKRDFERCKDCGVDNILTDRPDWMAGKIVNGE